MCFYSFPPPSNYSDLWNSTDESDAFCIDIICKVLVETNYLDLNFLLIRGERIMNIAQLPAWKATQDKVGIKQTAVFKVRELTV